MAFIPAHNTVKITLVLSQEGHEVMNTWHVRKTSGFTLADLIAIAAAVNSWWDTEYSYVMPTPISYVRVETKDLTSATGLVYHSTAATRATGRVAAGVNPANVAYCVTQQTGFAGRTKRGRTYIPGIPLTFVTGNELVAGQSADYVSRLNDLGSSLSSLGFPLVVCSYRLNGVDRAEAETTLVGTFAAYDNIVDTQRRRLH
jgi:hypothetical protein